MLGLRADLSGRIREIGRLAVLPQVAWELTASLRNEATTSRDLQRIIENDAALSAKVLSLANSAYYSPRQKIATIERAITVIGFNELEFLALGIGLADVFDLSKVPKGFDGQVLWLHSLAVAWLARELAEAAFYLDAQAVVIAGLLHDLGRLVLATHLKDELEKIMMLVTQGASFYQAELDLGLNHGLIGAALAQNWKLPDVHLAAIRDHHAPLTPGPFRDSTCLVALADDLARKFNFGSPENLPECDLISVVKTARLDQRRVNGIIRSAAERLPAVRQTWLQMLDRK